MEYDFRGRSGSNLYAPAGAGGGSSLYPRVGGQPGPGATAQPQPGRAAPYHHPSSFGGAPPPTSTSSSPSSGVGIRVMIKPEYQITPPPQLVAQIMEVPRSAVKFDFEFEKRILAEAEKENPNWSKFAGENQPPKHTAPTSSMATTGDPVVDKYIAMGLGREAVSFAVLNYGDNPAKVKEFVKAYNLLHEMGFTSKNVPELLAIHDNDPDKVVQHLLSTSS